jgi:hypothetical protein
VFGIGFLRVSVRYRPLASSGIKCSLWLAPPRGCSVGHLDIGLYRIAGGSILLPCLSPSSLFACSGLWCHLGYLNCVCLRYDPNPSRNVSRLTGPVHAFTVPRRVVVCQNRATQCYLLRWFALMGYQSMCLHPWTILTTRAALGINVHKKAKWTCVCSRCLLDTPFHLLFALV